MNLRAVFLAKQVRPNADGTFDVQGGGVTDFWLDKDVLLRPPIRLQFGVILRLEVSDDEVDELQAVDLTVAFEERQPDPATSIPLVARRVPGETRYHLNVILNVTVDVPGPGEGYLRFSWDGGLIAVPRVYFRIRSAPE